MQTTGISYIETLAEWSEPREVETKYGARILRKAKPTESFSAAWKANRDALKAAGATFSKNRDNEWELVWWQPISEEKAAQREATREASKAVSVDIEIPAPEGLDYLPFQRAGIAFAMDRPATLIADEMGLGKTIQAIGVINADPTIQSVLVVCPAGLRLNWMRELERWLTRDMSIDIAAPKSMPSTQIVIVNYDILRKLASELRERTWDLLVTDECHMVKNPKAQRTIALLGKKGKRSGIPPVPAKRRLFLTGTPIVNRHVELLPIIEAIGGEVVQRAGSGFAYLKKYCGAHQTRFGWDFSNSTNGPQLQEILRETCMVRRLKADVLTELPAKRRQVIEIPANGASRVIRDEHEAMARHEEMIADLRARVELAKASEDRAEYEAAVNALRDGQRAVFTEIAQLRHATAIAKIPAVISHVEDAVSEGEHKVVVFAHHHDVQDALMEHFGDKAVLHRGGLSNTEKQDAVDRFQSDPNTLVFVGSIQASGVGITLTASSHVIFAELDWVPGNMSQAEDRCHRIGQHDNVLVQHLVLEGSLDATMARTLIEKQEIIDKALDREIPERNEPVSPIAGTTVSLSRERIAKEAEELTPEQVAAVHEALRLLAGMCDGAATWDGQGFSKLDARIGPSLAATPELTARQAALGKRIALRYKRTQLPAELVEQITAPARAERSDG